MPPPAQTEDTANGVAAAEPPWWRGMADTTLSYGYMAPLLAVYIIALDKTTVIHFGFIALVVLLLAVPRHSGEPRISGPNPNPNPNPYLKGSSGARAGWC